jgi:hypothetical protein
MFKSLAKLFGRKPDAVNRVVAVDCDHERLWILEGAKAGPSVRWTDLEGVAIRTTESGPSAEDVWWLLGHAEGVLTIPNGAEGIAKMIGEMQKRLQTFQNARLIEALTCTENRTFLLWDRKGRHIPTEAG